MSQSNAIFAYLFFAFVIFITMRGKLPRYLGFLLGTGSNPAPVPQQKASNGTSPIDGLLGIGSLIPGVGPIFGAVNKVI